MAIQRHAGDIYSRAGCNDPGATVATQLSTVVSARVWHSRHLGHIHRRDGMVDSPQHLGLVTISLFNFLL